jgi:hypothetical protein
MDHDTAYSHAGPDLSTVSQNLQRSSCWDGLIGHLTQLFCQARSWTPTRTTNQGGLGPLQADTVSALLIEHLKASSIFAEGAS